MGLIKTGLVLAGGYGLIKAASRAANDHEDKKQQRQNKNGRYGPSVYHQEPNTSNMDYMYRNQYSSQPYNGAEYPQWGPPHEYRPYHGPPMGHTQHHGQPRSIEGSQMYYPIPENRAPPPYSEPHPTKAQGH
ncbi:uncharacterized protein N7469_011482 [Penicillium citrinum]|uniref:Uncharacterized protein n=1 Tax=Penicillium citrinum TaxID=5077 RepID=A0A9W9NDG2_PENCI|nr:uncharacterized protein N7469_011482 [Penicillium citrinum]KAJ5217857.1 hypothetical protein N7469_011482 [Penicillium citrinum]